MFHSSLRSLFEIFFAPVKFSEFRAPMKFPELKGSSYVSSISKIGLAAIRFSYEYRRTDGQTDRVISRTRRMNGKTLQN